MKITKKVFRLTNVISRIPEGIPKESSRLLGTRLAKSSVGNYQHAEITHARGAIPVFDGLVKITQRGYVALSSGRPDYNIIQIRFKKLK